MNKLLFLFFAILVTLNSCKAQDTSNNKLKNGKKMERTTERFDSWKYYTQRQGSEYLFENYFCVVMLGLTNVNILYYSFSTLYQMCNLRYNHIRVCDFFP